MPINPEWAESGATFYLIGDVTSEEIRNCVFGYSGDPRADSARYKIVDMRSAGSLAITKRELETLGAFQYGHTLSAPNVRLAFVTADDRFDAQIEAFARLTREGTWEVRIFRDADQAQAWAQDSLPFPAQAAAAG